MPAADEFNPEVGVSDADIAAVDRLCAAYQAVQEDYPQYEQTLNTTTGVWQPIRCSCVKGGYFLGIDEDGYGIFLDRDNNRGYIPVSFITTPRAQWVADWEARKQAKVEEFNAARNAAEAKVRARVEQGMREAHLQQLASDRALQRAIANPISFTPRGVNAAGDNAEDMTAWQARAVKMALAQL